MRILTDKQYEKMTDWETGNWYHKRTFNNSALETTIEELEQQGKTYKVYQMTTRVRGYYDKVLLVKKSK